jgi:hypothetical protein
MIVLAEEMFTLKEPEEEWKHPSANTINVVK